MSHCLDGLGASSSWLQLFPAVTFTELFRDEVGISCCRKWERHSLGSRGSGSWVAAGKEPGWSWHDIPWRPEAAVGRRKEEDILQISSYSEEYRHFRILVIMWKGRVYLPFQFLPFLYAVVSILNRDPRDKEVIREFEQLEDGSIQRWWWRMRKLWHQLMTSSPIWNGVSQEGLCFTGRTTQLGNSRVPETCCSDLQSYPDQKFNSIATVVDIILPFPIVKD